MPKMTKNHYQRACKFALSLSDNGQNRISEEMLRDTIDLRYSGDLSCAQLDLLLAHAKRRHPHCFTKRGEGNVAQDHDQEAAPEVCASD